MAHLRPRVVKSDQTKFEVRDGKKVRVAKSGKVLPESNEYKRAPKPKIEDEEPADNQ